jgi:spore germination protein GerM
MNRPIIFGILLFFIVFIAIFFIIRNRPSSDQPVSSTTTADSTETNRRRINVKLYFGTAGSGMLQTEERSIPYHETLHAQAHEVMAALLAGPKGDLVPTIPEGVKLLDILVSKDGVAYVDLSGEIVSNHQGGTTGEMVTIYSIVNTLAINLPQIHWVQILIDDRAVDTLKGHMDLSRPLKPDLSLARQDQVETRERTAL